MEIVPVQPGATILDRNDVVAVISGLCLIPFLLTELAERVATPELGREPVPAGIVVVAFSGFVAAVGALGAELAVLRCAEICQSRAPSMPPLPSAVRPP